MHMCKLLGHFNSSLIICYILIFTNSSSEVNCNLRDEGIVTGGKMHLP